MAIKFLFRSSRGLSQSQPLRLPRCSPAGLAALARSAASAAAASGAEAAATGAVSAALYLRACLVDVQRAAAEIKPVQGGNGAFRLG
jgi:hypothetical protein